MCQIIMLRNTQTVPELVHFLIRFLNVIFKLGIKDCEGVSNKTLKSFMPYHQISRTPFLGISARSLLFQNDKFMFI